VRINHANIVVANLELSLAFYEGTLGLKRVFEQELSGEWLENLTSLARTSARCVFLQPEAGGTRIELLQYLKPVGGMVPNNSLSNTQGLRHIAFEVDDVDAIFEKLLVAGTPVKSEPVEVPFAVMGTKKRLFYAMDPDGVIVEFCELRPIKK
jgi:catechol 2,3-dioxygenase-like lactoylglutathione lyase family enzyme